MVRAKFRVMEISRYWNGECTCVRLLPVYAKCDRFPDEKDVSEENARFWDATPSGEAALRFDGVGDVPFILGDCYFIDMAPAEESEWKLATRTHRETQLDVELSRSWQDKVVMSINNESAWDAFGGKIGAPWSVHFTRTS